MKWKCSLELGIWHLLSEKFSSTNRGTSGVFNKDFGVKIKAAIKDPSSVDKYLRFFVKKSGFQILNIPSLGARDVLNCRSSKTAGRSHRNVGGKRLSMRVFTCISSHNMYTLWYLNMHSRHTYNC